MVEWSPYSAERDSVGKDQPNMSLADGLRQTFTFKPNSLTMSVCEQG